MLNPENLERVLKSNYDSTNTLSECLSPFTGKKIKCKDVCVQHHVYIPKGVSSSHNWYKCPFNAEVI